MRSRSASTPERRRSRSSPTRPQLERLVVNLVTNAIKFVEGPGTVHVETRPDPAGGGLLVVRDTGIGISPEDQEKMFARFYRAPEASARAVPGSGLGLSIVQSIVAAHGGTVEVTSARGAGTTITVRLPAAPPLPEEPAAARTESAPSP